MRHTTLELSQCTIHTLRSAAHNIITVPVYHSHVTQCGTQHYNCPSVPFTRYAVRHTALELSQCTIHTLRSAAHNIRTVPVYHSHVTQCGTQHYNCPSVPFTRYAVRHTTLELSQCTIHTLRSAAHNIRTVPVYHSHVTQCGTQHYNCPSVPFTRYAVRHTAL